MSKTPTSSPLESDVVWDSGYLQLEPPEQVYTFADFGVDRKVAPYPFAITSAFRMLSDEGVGVAQAICGELRAHALATTFTATQSVGAVHRSEFLRGLAADRTLAGFLADLARAPLEPHPIAHHAIVVNYRHPDLARDLSQWHHDSGSFAYVLTVSDPRPMRGGRFEYFAGSLAEGARLLRSAEGIPSERTRAVEFPGAGWAVLMQGHRVMHRVTRLDSPYERTTLVGGPWAAHPAIPDPVRLDNLRKAYGDEIALAEWGDYLSAIEARGKAFSVPLEAARAELESALAELNRVEASAV